MGNNFVDSHISDDEICETILNEASYQTLIFYVEIKQLNNDLLEYKTFE